MNLFKSLYTYRPRGGFSPSENFLTESFAYVLRNNHNLFKDYVFQICQEEIVYDDYSIETQKSFQINDFIVYPDLTITFWNDKHKYLILCEHKWGSPLNISQLQNYRAVLDKFNGYRLVFIGVDEFQKSGALEICDKAFLWQDIFKLLQNYQDDILIKELSEFLSFEGLCPREPFSNTNIQSYIFGKNIPDICKNFIKKLSQPQFKWDMLPKDIMNERCLCGERWGRIGIDFGKNHNKSENWIPYNLFIGFLIDEVDHKVKFVSNNSFDFMISFDLNPTIEFRREINNDIIKSLHNLNLNIVIDTRDSLENKWRFLLIRKPLIEILKHSNNDIDQLNNVYEFCSKILLSIYENNKLGDMIIK